MKNKKDRIGEIVGRLKIVGYGEDQVSSSGRRHTMWVCECSCGNIVSVRSDSLNGKHTLSCGCYHKERVSAPKQNVKVKHGESRERIYNIWYLMRYRCSVKDAAAYKNYGGRGITVCDEWNDSEDGYFRFKEWARQNGYNNSLTIERIDVNLGYSPENCRWIPMDEQNANKRNNHILSYNGETKTLSEWSRITGIPMKTLHRRISLGWDTTRALTQPLRKITASHANIIDG